LTLTYSDSGIQRRSRDQAVVWDRNASASLSLYICSQAAVSRAWRWSRYSALLCFPNRPRDYAREDDTPITREEDFVPMPIPPSTTDDELVSPWLHGKSPHTIGAYRDDVAAFRAFTGAPPEPQTQSRLTGISS